MQGISCNGQGGWWIAIGVGAVLLMLGTLVLWRQRQRARQAGNHARQESMLQSCQGLILRLDAIARRLPPGHPARSDLVAVIARAEQVLEKGLHRAQHRRDGGTPL